MKYNFMISQSRSSRARVRVRVRVMKFSLSNAGDGLQESRHSNEAPLPGRRLWLHSGVCESGLPGRVDPLAIRVKGTPIFLKSVLKVAHFGLHDAPFLHNLGGC